MIIRVGVGDIAKELEIELPPDAKVDEIKASIESALNGDLSVLWITDKDGGKSVCHLAELLCRYRNRSYSKDRLWSELIAFPKAA